MVIAYTVDAPLAVIVLIFFKSDIQCQQKFKATI